MKHEHRLSLGGSVSRAVQEWQYFATSPWSLDDVGKFWSSVTDYDDINEASYTYYRRFADTFELARELIGRDNLALDIQSRTGNGCLFWAERGFIRRADLVDFSEHMLAIASSKLSEAGVEFKAHLVKSFPLPFPDETFDLVLSYETIEHIWDRAAFVCELARVLKASGWIVLTCPNVLWEPAHSLAAILNLHHSEGPHRFLRRSTLLSLIGQSGLEVAREDSTIILPFASEFSKSVDRFLEQRLPPGLTRALALRRIFLLRKSDQ
ncbi:MAG: methyltransferase domain-containing protein [Anaerolineae bacterium]|nr:methyltransferase domain-containing protein [Anaerolineae bacterium]NIN96523.1 methyltransferase domain-containing protein [Anaerolineae bacterium]NIQ79552.1 methyltransferase domain-containing protein [Anaerolineae bacterium]